MTMWLLLASILCWTAAASVKKDYDVCNTYKEYTGCSTDCSQSHSRVKGEQEFFNCTIGGRQAVTNYLAINKDAFVKGIEKKFDSPTLTSVDFYLRDHFPSLAINFSLPKSVKETSAYLHPDAILLDFEGLKNRMVLDGFYSNCPRQRLFHMDYNPKFAIDAENPRTLRFDCLIGLDRNPNVLNKRAYNVTLTTAFGNSSTYIVTIHNMPEIGDLWFPVIATHLDVGRRSITVVFERAPAKQKVQSYQVMLLTTSNEKIDQKEVHGGNPVVEFTDVKKGNYSVWVIPIGGLCADSLRLSRCSFESYFIDGHQLPDESGDYLDRSLSFPNLIAMVTGCVISITVLLLAVYCVHKKRKCNDDQLSGLRFKGMILHPFSTNSLEEKCVEKFKEYLQTLGNCHLHVVNDEMSITQLRQQDKTDNYTFVIVFYTDRDSCRSFYSDAITEVVQIRDTQNNLHIIPVTFPFCQNAAKPNSLSSLETLHLMKNMKELFDKIIGLDLLPLKNRYLLDEGSFSDCPAGRALADSLASLDRPRDKSEESIPLLEHEADKPSEDDMTESINQSVPPECREMIRQRIMKINSDQPKRQETVGKTEDLKMREIHGKRDVTENGCGIVENGNGMLIHGRTDISRHQRRRTPEDIRMTRHAVRPFENQGNASQTCVMHENGFLSNPEDCSEVYDPGLGPMQHFSSLPANSNQAALLHQQQKLLHAPNSNVLYHSPFSHGEFHAIPSHEDDMPFNVEDVIGEENGRGVFKSNILTQTCSNQQGLHMYPHDRHHQGQGQKEFYPGYMSDNQIQQHYTNGDYGILMNGHVMNGYSVGQNQSGLGWVPDNQCNLMSRGEPNDARFSHGINPSAGPRDHWPQGGQYVSSHLSQRTGVLEYQRCPINEASVKINSRRNKATDDFDIRMSDEVDLSQPYQSSEKTKSSVESSLLSDYNSYNPVPPTDEDDESLSEGEQCSEMLKINQNSQN